MESNTKKRKYTKKELDELVVNGNQPESQEEANKPHTIIGSFDKTHIAVLESSIKNNTPVLLIGHTGLGKTTLVKELANQKNKKLRRVSVHSGITADEIIGKWLAINGSTVWQDGILTNAMKNGEWVVFDEINALPADVMFALHSLLDDDRIITLLEKDSEVIEPHEEFRFFATMNPPDDYAGTKELNMAFLSRFNAVVNITPYESKIETQILVSKGIDLKTAMSLVSFGNQLRTYKFKDEINFFCGTRDLINSGKLMGDGLTIEQAVNFGIINKMMKDDQDFVLSKNINFKFKTEEQKQIEALQEFVTKLGVEKEILSKENQDLKKKTQEQEGVFLDPKVQKALKLLNIATGVKPPTKSSSNPVPQEENKVVEVSYEVEF